MSSQITLKHQAIEKFNLQVSLLVSLFKVLVPEKQESYSNYGTFETVINKLLIPSNPKLILTLFKNIISENETYREYILEEDDSFFSNEKIFSEYSSVFNNVIKSDKSGDGNLLAGVLLKKFGINDSKVSKINGVHGSIDEKGNINLSKINCDDIVKSHKTKITELVNEYRTKWDHVDEAKKKQIWRALKIMLCLVDKYFKS